jgi:hypothetical protein
MEKIYKNQYLQDLIGQTIGNYGSTPRLEAFSQAENHNIVAPVDKDLNKRTAFRIYTEEIKRQQNLEDVFDYADEELGKHPEQEGKAVDEDWSHRFVTFAKDISDSELKSYWGRLLAGEIKSTGTYSYRMMLLMSQLSKREADSIREVFKYVMFLDNDEKVLILKTMDYSPITMGQLLFMQELGLIDSKDNLSVTYTNNDNTIAHNYVFTRNGIGLVFTSKALEVVFPIYKLTSIGKEFLLLNSDVEIDMDYLKKVAELTVKEQKNAVSVKCGRIQFVSQDRWRMIETFF